MVGIKSNTRPDCLAIGNHQGQTLGRLPRSFFPHNIPTMNADLLKRTPLNSCVTDQEMTSTVCGGNDGVDRYLPAQQVFVCRLTAADGGNVS